MPDTHAPTPAFRQSETSAPTPADPQTALRRFAASAAGAFLVGLAAGAALVAWWPGG